MRKLALLGSGLIFSIGVFGDVSATPSDCRIILTGLRKGKAEGCGCNPNTQYTISREATLLRKLIDSTERSSTYLVDVDYDAISEWDVELKKYFKLFRYDVAERRALNPDFTVTASGSTGNSWQINRGLSFDIVARHGVSVGTNVVLECNGVPVHMDPGNVTVISVRNGKVSSEAYSIGANIIEDPEIKELLDQKAERSRNELIGLLSRKQSAVERQDQPASCASCHSSEYLSWSQSKHALAMDTLEKKARLESECIQCHSTKARQGYKLDLNNLQIEDSVTCLSCHDAEATHRKNPNVKYTESVSETQCLPCHTPQNSPKFKFENYKHKVHEQSQGKGAE